MPKPTQQQKLHAKHKCEPWKPPKTVEPAVRQTIRPKKK